MILDITHFCLSSEAAKSYYSGVKRRELYCARSWKSHPWGKGTLIPHPPLFSTHDYLLEEKRREAGEVSVFMNCHYCIGYELLLSNCRYWIASLFMSCQNSFTKMWMLDSRTMTKDVVRYARSFPGPVINGWTTEVATVEKFLLLFMGDKTKGRKVSGKVSFS